MLLPGEIPAPLSTEQRNNFTEDALEETPEPLPPYLTAPHPKTLLADFSREFSEEFLSGTAGWCRRHDSSRGG